MQPKTKFSIHLRIIVILLVSCIPLVADGDLPPASSSKESVEDTSSLPKPEGDHVEVSSDVYKRQFFTTLIAIIILVIVLFIIIWLIKRVSSDRPLQLNHRKTIKILEKRALSPNTYLYHIQVGDKQCILAESKYEIKNILNLEEFSQEK